MSHGTRSHRAPGAGALLLGLALAAGCAGARPFVYQPSAARAAGSPLPLEVAVLPFQNGTEDFERRGSYLQPETLWFNLTRTGISGTIEPVTPPLWARGFAAELAASGRFRGARFAYDAAELSTEEYVVEGKVLKAYVSGGWENPSLYELALRAVRRKDGRTVWERTVSRSYQAERSLYDSCGASLECMNGKAHAELNRVVQGMYAEAAADLAQALGGKAPPGAAARPADRAGGAGGAGGAGEGSGGAAGSVEETIRRIMEGR